MLEFLELAYHYATIILLHDYVPVAGGVISEDSPALELAYNLMVMVHGF